MIALEGCCTDSCDYLEPAGEEYSYILRNHLWDKLGLAIPLLPGITEAEIASGKRAHNLVLNYVVKHNDRLDELLYPNGYVKYYKVLALAEQEEQVA